LVDEIHVVVKDTVAGGGLGPTRLAGLDDQVVAVELRRLAAARAIPLADLLEQQVDVAGADRAGVERDENGQS